MAAIADAVREAGFVAVRDKDDLRYRDSLRRFLAGAGESDLLVLVLSRACLESRSCMFELTEAAASPPA